MGIIYKAYYQCEGCGIETEDADQIRYFAGEVTNGNDTKSFIRPEQMYCISCLQFVLDHENKIPETVIIKNNNNSSVDPNLSTQIKEDSEIEKQLEENLKELQSLKESFEKRFNELRNSQNQIIEKIKTLEALQQSTLHSNNSHKRLEQLQTEEYEDFPTHEEDEIEKFNDDSSISNTSKEIQSDITYDELIEQTINLNSDTFQDFGDYIVLCQIKNSQMEEYFAKEKCGHKDAASLREASGNKSLINTWFSIDKYISEKDAHFDYSISARVINKIIFGIPNIVDKTIFISKNGYGYISKSDLIFK